MDQPLPERPSLLEPLVVAPKEAGRILGLGKNSIFELINNGTLESVKIGHARRITVESIRRLAAQGTPRLAAKGAPPQRKRGRRRPASSAVPTVRPALAAADAASGK
jgi:excisionase family DNA binding protein